MSEREKISWQSQALVICAAKCKIFAETITLCDMACFG